YKTRRRVRRVLPDEGFCRLRQNCEARGPRKAPAFCNEGRRKPVSCEEPPQESVRIPRRRGFCGGGKPFEKGFPPPAPHPSKTFGEKVGEHRRGTAEIRIQPFSCYFPAIPSPKVLGERGLGEG